MMLMLPNPILVHIFLLSDMFYFLEDQRLERTLLTSLPIAQFASLHLSYQLLFELLHA
jgi:hypothetical protein